ncbi:hypothetical protein KH389_26820 [Pseudomonas qingdaonensis]|uniref:Paraquat-inducible protein A n=1 Tax=Pseudomonas qingdaonensis TaxID=2056231 RepID=A0ABX8DS05_9PSED|nr:MULTISPECIES: hypothetical protein [Pseudomonas]QVL18927.1 hypothetical protein KH389_26820 [Pseudomonas qingdaonensis]
MACLRARLKESRPPYAIPRRAVSGRAARVRDGQRDSQRLPSRLLQDEGAKDVSTNKYKSAQERLCAAVDLNCPACGHVWLPSEGELETLMGGQPLPCAKCAQALVLPEADHRAMKRHLSRSNWADLISGLGVVLCFIGVLTVRHYTGDLTAFMVALCLAFVWWFMKEIVSDSTFLNVLLLPSSAEAADTTGSL